MIRYSAQLWCSCLHEEVPLTLYCNWLADVMIKIGLQDRAPDFPMSLHANEICEERKNFYGMFG